MEREEYLRRCPDWEIIKVNTIRTLMQKLGSLTILLQIIKLNKKMMFSITNMVDLPISEIAHGHNGNVIITVETVTKLLHVGVERVTTPSGISNFSRSPSKSSTLR